MHTNGKHENDLECLDSSTMPDGIAQPGRMRSLRVLLAEDTPALQKLVSHILEKRGHKVELAENGQQAVDMLLRQQFDVVLMDLQMPVMDGFQATAAIRQLDDQTKALVPTIALTVNGLEGERQRCLAAGMDAYVSKPIQRDELIETMERLGAAYADSDRSDQVSAKPKQA